jgi:DnaK suppressor protein|tara:strand:- start:163 stop:522 length:360 start_codon:yes stop_codon:yes gene_type:complete
LIKTPNKDINSIRSALESLRQEVILQKEKALKSIAPVELDQQRIGRLSRMDALIAKETASAAQRRRNLEIKKIESALIRIDNNEYGFCVKCGDEIPEERLKQDLATPICINCAQLISKQ